MTPSHPPCPPKNKAELFDRIVTLADGVTEYIVPEKTLGGYGGTGGPGKLLEFLLGINGGNADHGDFKGIEIKYKSHNNEKRRNKGKASSCMITLLHKDPVEGSAGITPLVKRHGRIDKKGRLSLRHTISGSTDFTITYDSEKIVVTNKTSGLTVHWDRNEITNSMSRKLDRIVVVSGRIRKVYVSGQLNPDRYVTFDYAAYYTGFKISDFIQNIMEGIILMEFDAVEKDPGSDRLRGHGTKFRMHLKNLDFVWSSFNYLVQPRNIP
jgi:hypothetical protein